MIKRREGIGRKKMIESTVTRQQQAIYTKLKPDKNINTTIVATFYYVQLSLYVHLNQ